MNLAKNKGIVKPYNIVVNNEDNSATINMYGEVVSARPVDWWTGELVPGNFIAQDEFLQDLEELADKEQITIHINSVGGDMYAGIAIYNRLKELGGKVTTINDGLAASAGSLIFMAGDTRKVNAGSNLMIHSAAEFLYGYYQAQDLKAAIKQLNAHDKAGINIYSERTGRPVEEIKPLVERETWMTGAEAVDAGFADEVISDESTVVNMKLAPNRTTMMVNGHPVAARCFGKLPESIQTMTEEEWAEITTPKQVDSPVINRMQPAPQDSINNHPNGGEEQVEIKNIEEMRKAFPELVAQVENAARTEGARTERERIQGIEDVQNVIGDAAMIRDAKFGEKPMDAKDLVFAAAKKQAAMGLNMLGMMQADANASNAADVTATAANGPEVAPNSPEAIKAQAKADVAAFQAMNKKGVR